MSLPATEMNSGLVRTHPVATWHELLGRRLQSPSQALLQTRGLELTYDGRSALYRVFCELAAGGRSHVLLPAFHCPSIVTSALAAGLKPRFYRIDRQLGIDGQSLQSLADADVAAVVVIHFFGVQADLSRLTAVLNQGIALIEDWSHSFLDGSNLSLNGVSDAYRIYSFWKLVPSGVGGGLMRPHGAGPTKGSKPRAGLGPRFGRSLRFWKSHLEETSAAHGPGWLHRSLIASDAWRARWRGHGQHAVVLLHADLREQGERYYPFNPALAEADMPLAARNVIEGTELAALAFGRRGSFERYARGLAHTTVVTPVTPVAPRAVPWVFPVLVAERDSRDFRWRQQGVPCHTFGSYLHSALFSATAEATVADARYLSHNLLCLAIHRDVTPEQIDAACDVIGRDHCVTTVSEA